MLALGSMIRDCQYHLKCYQLPSFKIEKNKFENFTKII